MEQAERLNAAAHPGPKIWLWSGLLVAAIVLGIYYRMTGLDWGEQQYLHPDERFLVWVGSDITPVKCLDETVHILACPEEQQKWLSWREYFDAAASPMNPNNRGHGFYVYGTLPMFLTRYVVQLLYGHSGFNEMTEVGRLFSAMADILTILLVYLIAERVYSRRIGVLAAAFYAAAVMPIQQSHFFTMDTFQSFFMCLAVYFGVLVATAPWPEKAGAQAWNNNVQQYASSWRFRLAGLVRQPFFVYSIGFGIALGCAVASKLSAAPVAIILPGAFSLQFLRSSGENRRRRLLDFMIFLVLGAVVSLLVFRVFQPYAFSGPGFFGLRPNPEWIADIQEQRNQAAGDLDFPPAMQWARRPVWFSGKNMVLWGLGLPLGILAWSGFLWAGWRMLADKSTELTQFYKHALLWGWTALYFVWQSLQFNPTMRYQLPVYPLLVIFAAWIVFELVNTAGQINKSNHSVKPRASHFGVFLAVMLGLGVLGSTHIWAIAFSGIYNRPITRIEASRWIYQNLPGPVTLQINTAEGNFSQPLPVASGTYLQPEIPLTLFFEARQNGSLEAITFPGILDELPQPGVITLQVTLKQAVDGSEIGRGLLTADFGPVSSSYQIALEPQVPLFAGENYILEINILEGIGRLEFQGAAPANEGDWDDGLPVRLDGYDPFGGLYQSGLNFNMYTDDNPEKLARFITVLDEADHLFISSSRQWGSLPRLPERYPLVTTYYRYLLGCPPEQSIEWCYNMAQPGMFQGELGFELIQVFQADPAVGSLKINDQFAEEAFTVYDHPKVFIFQKTEDYHPENVIALLNSVDFSQVVRVTPKRAGSHPANLMLPPGRWAVQQSGGTWADLFPPESPLNQSQGLAVLAWYFTLSLLGVLVFPLLFLALPAMVDRGYPMARLAGLLLLAFGVWAAGSLRIPFNRSTIIGVFVLLGLLSGLAAVFRQQEISRWWRTHRRDVLLIEGLFLLFFILDLLLRIGNPDLWHPWKGGEKPMDFAYFNAVLKSTSFPPYDPWFAGGYLNYYYYGFVLFAVLVKLLGITPSIAYNLIIPTIFAMIGLGAFSLTANLVSERRANQYHRHQLLGGMAGALGMALLGNLGTVRMLFQGYQRLAAPGGITEGASLVTRWVWAIRGFFSNMQGAELPYGIGDWYWIPSRAIPAPGDVEPITEFPFFTVLYGDPHAHLFALPLTLLALAFGLNFIRGRARWPSWIHAAASFFLGGLAIGALRPTNTWDFYPYLALGIVAVVYTLFVYFRPKSEFEVSSALGRRLVRLPGTSQRIFITAGGVLLLVVLSLFLYQPYANWYGLGYGKVDIWRGTHTPISAYLTHWGLFLYVILTWLVWESVDWMATTPVSSLRKLEPYRGLIQATCIILLVFIGGLLWMGVKIAWFILLTASWAGILLLKPDQSDQKRFVLFLIGTGLVLTLMVEVIVLRGDIGRMNTVFKFYLQVWTMFSISAAAALIWLLKDIRRWEFRTRTLWQIGLTVLVGGAALYPLLGGMAKVRDRMAPEASHSLDGMAFMQAAEYADTWGLMDLNQDYQAIQWMLHNVEASPVIVEANLRNLYRWGSRYSIYTGLPGVVGWEWHQQQQRSLIPGSVVSDRIAEIDNFYMTTDLGQAREFLSKYDVQFIILGQQERGLYAGEGLAKFPAAEGVLWRAVYQDRETVIYEVLSSLPGIAPD